MSAPPTTILRVECLHGKGFYRGWCPGRAGAEDADPRTTPWCGHRPDIDSDYTASDRYVPRPQPGRWFERPFLVKRPQDHERARFGFPTFAALHRWFPDTAPTLRPELIVPGCPTAPGWYLAVYEAEPCHVHHSPMREQSVFIADAAQRVGYILIDRPIPDYYSY